MQNHLFEHIGDRVALETVLVDGEVRVRSGRGTRSLAESRHEMYVHPCTGILLINRARVKAAREAKAERTAKAQAQDADRRTDIPGLAPDRQWHRIDGIWYEVQLRALDDGPPAFDIVLKRPVSAWNRMLLKQTYGRGGVFAVTKRQLDGRTMARHGLR